MAAPDRWQTASLGESVGRRARHGYPYDLGMRFQPKRAVIGVCVILALGFAGRWAYAKWESTYGTPSCSWPLRVHGTATSGQEGLVRCYMKALVTRNTPLIRPWTVLTPVNGRG